MADHAAKPFAGTSLIDGHVHYHGCFDRARFLSIANENFEKAGRQLGIRDHLGWLMFTDMSGERHFNDFRRACGDDNIAGWRLHPTGESCSLIAATTAGERLLLVAGRQIVTSEGLEVLALGLEEELPDGKPLAESLHRIEETGALPVLPWGFGKWWFRRGQILASYLQQGDLKPRYFVGDNAGRPRLLGRPKLFNTARARGIRNLPGTDPLPFPSELHKIGSFGFRLDAAMDLTCPFASLKAILEKNGSQPDTYGRVESLVPFLRNQVSLRLSKR